MQTIEHGVDTHRQESSSKAKKGASDRDPKVDITLTIQTGQPVAERKCKKRMIGIDVVFMLGKIFCIEKFIVQ